MVSYSNFGKILQSGLHVNCLLPKPLSAVRWMATITTGVNQYDDPQLAAAKPFEEIPCIPSLPIIGSAWIYMPLIGRYKLSRQHQADLHKHAVYGDIVREKIGSFNVVHTFIPEVMEIFCKHEGQYPSRGELSAIKAYREYRKEWYKTGGVMVLQGKEWWDLRSKTQKHMMKPKTIQSYLFPMQGVASDFVKRIYSLRDNNKEVPHFLEELYKWALEC
ncbi:putative cytochrome P450 49a1, partial [Stegodyphus mimosarum]